MVPGIAPLRQAGNAASIYINIIATNNCRKKLLIADMDSTIITDESIDEMPTLAGFGDDVAEITERSVNNKLDFDVALVERAAIFSGQPASLFEQIIANTQLTAGAATLLQTTRRHQKHCYLVSGGFSPIVDRIATICGFHATKANEMITHNGVITGSVKKPVLGRVSKAQILTHYITVHKLASDDTTVIGDGANDMAALKAAGMAVA